MISTRIAPSLALLQGRRALEGLDGVKLIQDWMWDKSLRKWLLHCQLTVAVRDNEYIRATTNWYVLVDNTYPWGTIKFFPARQDGITQTFPHQSYNADSEAMLWRSGDLCLNTSIRSLGLTGYDVEPYDSHKRLRWHFERAQTWLMLASEGRLSDVGDPFELPQFPSLNDEIAVAFCEGADSFEVWQSCPLSVGVVEFAQITERIWFVKRFLSLEGVPILTPNWGTCLNGKSEVTTSGIWIQLNRTPVLPPWQAPATWGDLRLACGGQNVLLDEKLKQVAGRVRDGKKHIVLLGIPIANVIGDSVQQIHWQGLLLPVLSHKGNTSKGFRTNEKGYWIRDQTVVLKDDTALKWISSENWHKDQISTRGQLPSDFAKRRILLVGVGALGSAVAELLIRAGVSKILLVDFDVVEVGNLVRHTLQLCDLGASKAITVAERLNLTSPHAVVEAINDYFPPQKILDIAKIKECDTIIDCTGSDQALFDLSVFDWGAKKRLFISLSVGLFAKRLYALIVSSATFPEEQFRTMVKPWLERDIAASEGQVLPREGIGCWNPVFPARLDDLWLFASVAVKHLVEVSSHAHSTPMLTIFEQEHDQTLFAGVRKLSGNSFHD